MISKKSQITLFIILGIVIFMITGFLLYITSLRTSQTGSQAEKSFSDIVEATPIRSYITSCLKKTAEDALILAGRQGGVIYSGTAPASVTIPTPIPPHYADQGGLDTLPWADLLRITPGQTSFLRQESGNTLHIHYAIDNAEAESSLYGSNRLPKLCLNRGLNPAITSSGSADLAYTCLSDLYQPTNAADSVQSTMQQYLNSHMPDCVNLEQISEDFPIHAEITKEPVSGILFGEEDVLAVVDYTITFSAEGEPPITKDFVVTQSIPVRFKKLYEAAYFMIQKDIEDYAFDILTDPQTCPDGTTPRSPGSRNCLGDGIGITKLTDICEGCSANQDAQLVAITDDHSLIQGQPFSFVFARKNREPVLAVPQPTILVEVGNSVIIDHNVYSTGDPDEESPVITLTRWDKLPSINTAYTTTADDVGWHAITIIATSGIRTSTASITINVLCASANTCCNSDRLSYKADTSDCGNCMTCQNKACAVLQPPSNTPCTTYVCDTTLDQYVPTDTPAQCEADGGTCTNDQCITP